MSPRAGTARSRAIVKAILAQLGPDADARAKAFADQAAPDAAPDELPEIHLDDLAANLADFWRFGARRRGRKPALRIAPMIGGQGLDRLEIVQDDCPFLVDSIMGEIADQGLSVRAMFHPIVERDGGRRVSMIQVILDPIGRDREAALTAGINATLNDVRAAVADFPEMLGLMGQTLAELQASPRAEPEETAFLAGLKAEHFVFLGARLYEYPRLANGDYTPEEPLYRATDGWGVLRDPERTVLRRASEPALLTATVKDRLASDPALMVAKSNVRSRVHRRGYMDYIGVKRYGADGRPVGEVRFVGLFTAEAYDQPADQVPLIRAKLDKVRARAGVAPGSHNEKRLHNILENYPRDELFQMTVEDLLTQALGVVHLYDRPKVRLFERKDPFDRFASLLLFVPRDRYDSDLAARAGRLIAQAYGGRVSAAYPSFSDAPLARIHYIIGFTPGAHEKPNLKALETTLAEAARTWGGPVRDGDPRPGPGAGGRGRDPEPLARRLPSRLPGPVRRGRGPGRHGGDRGDGRSGRPGARLSDHHRFHAAVPLQALPGRGARGAGRRLADRRQHGAEGPGRGGLPGGPRRSAAGLGP